MDFLTEVESKKRLSLEKHFLHCLVITGCWPWQQPRLWIITRMLGKAENAVKAVKAEKSVKAEMTEKAARAEKAEKSAKAGVFPRIDFGDPPPSKWNKHRHKTKRYPPQRLAIKVQYKEFCSISWL